MSLSAGRPSPEQSEIKRANLIQQGIVDFKTWMCEIKSHLIETPQRMSEASVQQTTLTCHGGIQVKSTDLLCERDPNRDPLWFTAQLTQARQLVEWRILMMARRRLQSTHLMIACVSHRSPKAPSGTSKGNCGLNWRRLPKAHCPPCDQNEFTQTNYAAEESRQLREPHHPS